MKFTIFATAVVAALGISAAPTKRADAIDGEYPYSKPHCHC